MRPVHAIFLVALTALSIGTASAQHFRGGGFGSCRGIGCGTGSHMGIGYGDSTVVAQARLDALRARLLITDAQGAQWQAFAGAMLRQAEVMDIARTRMFESSGTSAQRMTLQADLMMQQAEAFDDVADAYSALYAVLSTEQRATADRQWGLGMGPGFGWSGS